jgi:hypothetical protein
VDEFDMKLDVSEIFGMDSRNIPVGKKELFNDFGIPAKLGEGFLILVLK